MPRLTPVWVGRTLSLATGRKEAFMDFLVVLVLEWSLKSSPSEVKRQVLPLPGMTLEQCGDAAKTLAARLKSRQYTGSLQCLEFRRQTVYVRA